MRSVHANINGQCACLRDIDQATPRTACAIVAAARAHRAAVRDSCHP
jgi:hypothetical protein